MNTTSMILNDIADFNPGQICMYGNSVYITPTLYIVYVWYVQVSVHNIYVEKSSLQTDNMCSSVCYTVAGSNTANIKYMNTSWSYYIWGVGPLIGSQGCTWANRSLNFVSMKSSESDSIWGKYTSCYWSWILLLHILYSEAAWSKIWYWSFTCWIKAPIFVYLYFWVLKILIKDIEASSMTLMSVASKSCYELIACSCKKGCTTSHCKCKKSSLSCTALCHCEGECGLWTWTISIKL